MAQAAKKEAIYPHIIADPSISGGQPVVEGTRIPVATLVRAHQLGMDFDEILLQYPHLDASDLHAAFLYYLDHKEAIDAFLEESFEPPLGASEIRIDL